MSASFTTTVENEYGVIREAQHETEQAVWCIKSTAKGVSLTRSDDETTVFVRVPQELVRGLLKELQAQVKAMEAAGLLPKE